MRVQTFEQSEQAKNKQQLQSNLRGKNLQGIYQNCLQAKDLDILPKSWTRYLVNVFSMLTDSQTQPKATFLRRAPVFNIFKQALQSLLIQQQLSSFPSEFLKCVRGALFSISPIYQSLYNKRLMEEIYNPFNVKIQKFLSVATGAITFQKSQCKLSQEQINILKSAYPFPNSPKQFKCSDLALWYQFFSDIKNFIFLYKYDEQTIIFNISKIKMQCYQVMSPYLKWIEIFNFFKQVIKTHRIYPQCEKIEHILLTYIVQMLEHINYIFKKFIQTNSSQKNYHDNIFKIIIRFNIILMSYCFIQSLIFFSNQKLIHNAIQQTKKLANTVLARIQNQINLIQLKKNNNQSLLTEDKNLLQKLIKVRIQIKWITYQLQRKINLIANKNESIKQFVLPKSQCPLPFQTSIKKISELVIQLSISETNAEKSENRQISLMKPPIFHQEWYVAKLFTQMLAKSPKKLQQLYFKSIFNPCISIKIFMMMLTEYYLCNTTFFVMTIKMAFKTFNQILSLPQNIDTIQKLDTIRICIMLFQLCCNFNYKNPPLNYLCSLCSNIGRLYWCKVCDQPRRLFIYPTDTPTTLAQHWLQYCKKCDAFNKVSLCKVPQETRQKLTQIFLQFQ